MSRKPDKWDDAPTFERNVNTKYGNGSVRAINKGKLKRHFKSERGKSK